MKHKYGVPVELIINKEMLFEDGLSLVLTSFSHKRPYTGGPTRATAYLSLTGGDLSDQLMLSIHGIQGKSAAEDGLADSERYERKRRQGYEFQLTGFSYDKSIEIKIEKLK